ncbi:MAG: hypothetical protein WAU32_06995 [Thermoanaerobaculia bacterium]
MKRSTTVFALCVAGLASAVLAQEPSSTQSTTTQTQTTQVSSDGVTTKTTVVQGKVVRYEPGKTIVLVGPDSRETTFTLTPKVEVPGDVRIGRQVSLSTEPSDSGQIIVTRITTQSMTPEGDIKTETQTMSTSPSGDQTLTKTTTITGTVSALEPGKSVTFLLPDKKTVVYTIDASSVVPSDMAVGKTYMVETTSSTSGGPLVVKKITTTKTTKKTTTVQP